MTETPKTDESPATVLTEQDARVAEAADAFVTAMEGLQPFNNWCAVIEGRGMRVEIKATPESV